MTTNPLKRNFRQPKFFISLPSKGLYNTPGTINGDPEKLPVYGMTGNDEIISRTPDTLLSGDSTVQVIQSCIPGITDAWQLSMLDADLVSTAVRIASNGINMDVTHTCQNPECNEENDYDLDLSVIMQHFASCVYDNKVNLTVVDELTITLRPLTYQQFTNFSISNFRLQQELEGANHIPADQQQAFIDEIWRKLSKIQSEIFVQSIESIQTPDALVVDRPHIEEWVAESEKATLDIIKTRLSEIRETWAIPKYNVQCSSCKTSASIAVNLDQSSFFGKA